MFDETTLCLLKWWMFVILKLIICWLTFAFWLVFCFLLVCLLASVFINLPSFQDPNNICSDYIDTSISLFSFLVRSRVCLVLLFFIINKSTVTSVFTQKELAFSILYYELFSLVYVIVLQNIYDKEFYAVFSEKNTFAYNYIFTYHFAY